MSLQPSRRGLLLGGAAMVVPGTVWGAGGKSPVRPDFESRVKSLGLDLPAAPAPVANYAPWRRAGAMLFIAGQGPALHTGAKVQGRVGAELSIQDGYAAARAAGLNILAQLHSALGSLNQVRQCLKLGGFVNSADSFHDQPKVINGASDLMVEVFGEAGKHARFAVGVNTLPFNVAVEIESVWEVWP